jgi:hypothetical protein
MAMILLILAVGAVYRLATDFAYERGPFNTFERIRSWAVVQFGEDHWLAIGLSCPVCLSFWLSLPAALLLQPGNLWLWYWLGIAGLVAFLARYH